MKISRNQYNAIINFLSRFEEAILRRCAQDLSLDTSVEDDFLYPDIETIHDFLRRIFNNDPKKVKLFLENFFDRVNWIRSDFYNDWINTLNEILSISEYVFDIDKTKIVKITNFDKVNPKISTYLKEINKYSDYVNAIRCNKIGLNVASMLYLRRILEELVYTLQSNLKTSEWLPFDQIYKTVKDKFSKFVREHLSTNFKLLSTFVHGLDEKEARKYFDCMKLIIDTEILNRVYKNKLPDKLMENLVKISTKSFNQLKENERK